MYDTLQKPRELTWGHTLGHLGRALDSWRTNEHRQSLQQNPASAATVSYHRGVNVSFGRRASDCREHLHDASEIPMPAACPPHTVPGSCLCLGFILAVPTLSLETTASHLPTLAEYLSLGPALGPGGRVGHVWKPSGCILTQRLTETLPREWGCPGLSIAFTSMQPQGSPVFLITHTFDSSVFNHP